MAELRGWAVMKRKTDDNWKKIQERTFTNWFNDRLRGNLKVAKRQVKSLETDLHDGLLLIELLEKLAAPKTVGHYNKKIFNNAQMLENHGRALRFIKDQSIKLVNIGPGDIHDGNLKLILGLIWTLIKEYQIKSSGRVVSTKKAMMSWVRTIIPEYSISNFNTDWNDGRALCGTIDHIRPGACPNHLALDQSRGLENCSLGMDLAQRLFDIPKIMSPEDLNSKEVDDLSVMTYLSYFCDPANQLLLQWIRKKIPNRNIKNLSTDWNDGINLGALVDACFPGVCPDWESMDPAQAIANNERVTQQIKDRLGLECPISAAELANPEVDEIVVATYLSGFKNAKMLVSPEEFHLHVPNLPRGCALIREPVVFSIDISTLKPDDLEELKVSAHGPSADAVVTLQPSKQGQLLATVTPTEAGKYDIMAAYKDENIDGSPFPLPVADPSKCHIFGDIPTYMQVGKPQEISLKTRGAGAGSPSVTCIPLSTNDSEEPLMSAQVKENENDDYSIILTPNAIGEATVHMKWAGEDIPNTPFTVNVCDASKCSVSGIKDEVEVGEPVVLKLTADPKEVGKAEPNVKPRGPSANYQPEITKGNNGGTYDISFTPWEVGPHKVDVFYGRDHVPTSPLSMVVKSTPDARACSATGKGLKKTIAGIPTAFNILAPNSGLPVGPQGIMVNISSPADHEVSDNGDGSYKVTYTAKESGSYNIEIKFHNKHIPGSPFNLKVAPAADASKCIVSGPALHPNSLKIAGNPLHLTVNTKEAGTGDLEVEVNGPDGIEPTVYIANEDRVYSIKFDVPKPGKYQVDILWAGVHVPGSPFNLKVHPGPTAGAVNAYGPGLDPSLSVGDTGKFTVETKNAGIGTLSIRVHGVKGAFKIVAEPESEKETRTLLARYDPQEPGDYIIAIRWSGEHVPGSPFNVKVIKSPKHHPQPIITYTKMSDENTEVQSKRKTKDKKVSIEGARDGEVFLQPHDAIMPATYHQPPDNMPIFASPRGISPASKISQGGLMASRSTSQVSHTTKSNGMKASSSTSQLGKKKKRKQKF